MPRPRRSGLPSPQVREFRSLLDTALDALDDAGRVIGNAQFGVYAFYDYDGEPIYVGQTEERLRVRIRRHLTNQRTDAVAMNVLDPFEVADVEVYPFYELEKAERGEGKEGYAERVKRTLGSAEYTVFQKVLKASALGAVLNEKDMPRAKQIKLPKSTRGRIIPADLYELRKHPDVRIARRASTVAALARVISERDVSPGLRRTLLTQARRLERLADQRLKDFNAFPVEEAGEETGDDEG
jgi:GIY-YIG catalytic domain